MEPWLNTFMRALATIYLMSLLLTFHTLGTIPFVLLRVLSSLVADAAILGTLVAGNVALMILLTVADTVLIFAAWYLVLWFTRWLALWTGGVPRADTEYYIPLWLGWVLTASATIYPTVYTLGVSRALGLSFPLNRADELVDGWLAGYLGMPRENFLWPMLIQHHALTMACVFLLSRASRECFRRSWALDATVFARWSILQRTFWRSYEVGGFAVGVAAGFEAYWVFFFHDVAAGVLAFRTHRLVECLFRVHMEGMMATGVLSRRFLFWYKMELRYLIWCTEAAFELLCEAVARLWLDVEGPVEE